MLFKKTILEKILTGEIRLAFRKWVKPTVKTGTKLHTPIGIVRIGQLSIITFATIKEKDIFLAGYKNLNQLKSEMSDNPSSKLYRIPLKYYGDDPRLELRDRISFTVAEKQALLLKIANLDRHGSNGPWVEYFLKIVSKNQGVRAAELSKLVNIETSKFKNDIRKLKNLGFTISLGTGYAISPRGKKVLRILGK